jgi:hypothetical protein
MTATTKIFHDEKFVVATCMNENIYMAVLVIESLL